jgi:hypothetical protein
LVNATDTFDHSQPFSPSPPSASDDAARPRVDNFANGTPAALRQSRNSRCPDREVKPGEQLFHNKSPVNGANKAEDISSHRTEQVH